MSELSSDDCDVDVEVENVLSDNLLPPVSKQKYLSAYDNFMKWKAQQNIKSLSEKVFLAYFNEISKNLKPSSLWGIYSMLKSTVRIKHNVYLKDYTNLIVWLRKRSAGYKSAKSQILTEENVKKFIDEAPDEKYLATKVAVIIGISGGCKAKELTAFTTNNIKMVDGMMLGVLFDLNKKTHKMFVIRDEFIPVVQKYQALRPSNLITNRFFMNFKNGYCTKQVIGRHKMANLPREIASYLKLPHPEKFTGHCFRRSAAALGGVMTTLDNQFTVERITDMVHTDSEEVGLATTEEAHIKPGEMESESADEMHIKTEEMELITVDEFQNNTAGVQQIPTNEFHIKTEEAEVATDLNHTTGFGTTHDKPTTSQASVSDGESRSSDIITDDSDDDEVDLVQIRSETVNRQTSLQSLREETSQETSSPHDTKITVAGKNITILFKNCANVGNVTVNIINK